MSLFDKIARGPTNRRLRLAFFKRRPIRLRTESGELLEMVPDEIVSRDDIREDTWEIRGPISTLWGLLRTPVNPCVGHLVFDAYFRTGELTRT